jgi:TM2 domain-containing membrane protein YozV
VAFARSPRLSGSPVSLPFSPWVGLGQIYNGEVLKGILFMVFSGVLFLTVFFYIGFFLLPAFWVYNIYDAYSTAVKSSRTPS